MADLEEIEDYLSVRFSARNAAAYVQRITAACHAIGLAPYRGAKRDDLHPGLRSTGFEKRVTITFSIENDAVLIVGVFYAGRLPY